MWGVCVCAGRGCRYLGANGCEAVAECCTEPDGSLQDVDARDGIVRLVDRLSPHLIRVAKVPPCLQRNHLCIRCDLRRCGTPMPAKESFMHQR